MGIVSRSQGGGAAHGFVVALAANTGALGNGATIPFDTKRSDTDNYFNTTTHVATIPAGLGGLYVISAYLDGAPSNTTGLYTCVFATSGAADNVGVPCVVVSGSATGRGGGGHVIAYAAGDTITPQLNVLGGAFTFTFAGGVNECNFALARVG